MKEKRKINYKSSIIQEGQSDSFSEIIDGEIEVLKDKKILFFNINNEKYKLVIEENKLIIEREKGFVINLVANQTVASFLIIENINYDIDVLTNILIIGENNIETEYEILSNNNSIGKFSLSIKY